MDLKTLELLITSVGFPIVCVLGMGFFIWQIYKQSVARENKLNEQIEASQSVNAKAIDTIAKYAEKLDTIQQDVKEIKNDVIAIKTLNK
jgi:chromosome segregation ATPase